ncbi:MAG TPA: hypothetical protein VGX76_19255, partial [Pirellulales bacterium]|nr:hypothetical protein [Pirellulales bacterium]
QNHFVAQYFQPVLAANVASWNVTRIQILAEQAGGNDDGQALVQIQTAVAGMPGNVVLDQATLDAGNLSSSYAWQTFSFSNANGISPSNGLCIVVTYLASAPSCKVQHCQDWAHAGGYVNTGNAGSTWTQSMGRDLRFYVYGTVMTPNPPGTNYQLTLVRCTLRTNTDPSSRVTTAIRVYNEPSVAGP